MCKLIITGPQREKTCHRGCANNKRADQPAHPRSLISAFVLYLLLLHPVVLAITGVNLHVLQVECECASSS